MSGGLGADLERDRFDLNMLRKGMVKVEVRKGIPSPTV
jgi:hypothetical protein